MKEGIRKEYKKQYDASTKRIDVVAVSYTHLDVYKRQVLNCLQVFCCLLVNLDEEQSLI